MKLYHLTIVFAIVAASVMGVTEMTCSQYEFIGQETAQTDRIFDDAVDEAVNLVAGTNRENIVKVRDEAVDAFFTYMYNSLGVIDSVSERSNIQKCVPVLAVADDDGFYVNYNRQLTDENGSVFTQRAWSDKTEFTYDDGVFLYTFTLSDRIKLTDYRRLVTSEEEGEELWMNRCSEDYGELMQKAEKQGNIIPDNVAFLSEDFDDIISHTIADTIERSMNYYCNLNNEMVRQTGIEYTLTLPDYDGTAYVRALTNRGFMALFCNYPLDGIGNIQYNRYSISDSQTVIKEQQSD